MMWTLSARTPLYLERVIRDGIRGGFWPQEKPSAWSLRCLTSGFTVFIRNPPGLGGGVALPWGHPRGPPSLSPAQLRPRLSIPGDCHTGRATEFINCKRAEVQNARRWIRMFSTLEEQGRGGCQLGNQPKGFRARTVWARESTPWSRA